MELDALRAASKSEAARLKAAQTRKRDLVVLILRHLVNAGFVGAYQLLSKETGVSLDRIDAADNVDLLSILQVRVALPAGRESAHPRARGSHTSPASAGV